MTKDQYKTVAAPSSGEYKDKGSKFHAYCFPLSQILEVEDHLDALKKLHPKARHICYAYRLGKGKQVFRTNDDGEPSGTAGKPILGAIDSYECTSLLIAVVRYFGGTKLGASGLIQAYKTAAKDALQNAEIIVKTIETTLNISFDYAHMGVVMDAAKYLDLNIHKIITENTPSMVVGIPQTEVEYYIKSLKSVLLGRPVSDITDDTEIDYLNVQVISEND